MNSSSQDTSPGCFGSRTVPLHQDLLAGIGFYQLFNYVYGAGYGHGNLNGLYAACFATSALKSLVGAFSPDDSDNTGINDTGKVV